MKNEKTDLSILSMIESLHCIKCPKKTFQCPIKKFPESCFSCCAVSKYKGLLWTSGTFLWDAGTFFWTSGTFLWDAETFFGTPDILVLNKG